MVQLIDGEPALEPCFHEFRRFYANRVEEYRPILAELGDGDNGLYAQWYKAGGYGYDPVTERKWLYANTSLPDFRGTCLDIGSGDGFWTWLLAEWYAVIGIDPIVGGVALADAIRKRLPLPIQRRTRFVVGDALTVTEQYDVIFCRAPSFFNYPIYKPHDRALFDHDRSRLGQVWLDSGYTPEQVAEKIAAYPKWEAPNKPMEKYADKWREYLERMLAITRPGGMFLFILSTKAKYYGTYIGDTYNHDPAEVERLFDYYGAHRVKMDTTGGYIVGEIYR